MILTSACLAGEQCRYTGTGYNNIYLQCLVAENRAIAVCPEVLGGLSIPRLPSEISGGDGFDVLAGRAKVVNKHGLDVTELFLRGAEETFKIVQAKGIDIAVLKERSPSCGCKQIYDGTFAKRLRQGCGCTTALLLQAGVRVISEKEAIFPWI